MTYDVFFSLIKQPDLVNASHEADLKEMVELYPSFAHARLLYTKSLQLSKGIYLDYNLMKLPIFCSNKRWLYYYLYPENKLSTEVYRRGNEGKSTGDYFDLIDIVEREGGDSKQSFKKLAEKLKSARSFVTGITPKLESDSVNSGVLLNSHSEKNTERLGVNTDYFDVGINEEFSENTVKILIAERKYLQAVEILRKLNLNNPKKSVYFADQIRFLEKIIANLKK